MKRFPSPGGDYGLSDLSALVLLASVACTFPSPGGDYGLSDMVTRVVIIVITTGFRPLAGITVFRTMWLVDYDMFENLVSVPWRGLRSFGPNDHALEDSGV